MDQRANHGMSARTRVLVAALLLAAVTLGLWQAVFVVTGLVGRGPARPRVARPPAVALAPIDTSWVNMKVWLSTHPAWTPSG